MKFLAECENNFSEFLEQPSDDWVFQKGGVMLLPLSCSIAWERTLNSAAFPISNSDWLVFNRLKLPNRASSSVKNRCLIGFGMERPWAFLSHAYLSEIVEKLKDRCTVC